MSTDHTALRATLARLHEQLASDDLDAESRALLGEALRDIEDALGREGSAAEVSLADRFAELAQEFEESHPTLAEAIGRVVGALANLGI